QLPARLESVHRLLEEMQHMIVRPVVQDRLEDDHVGAPRQAFRSQIACRKADPVALRGAGEMLAAERANHWKVKDGCVQPWCTGAGLSSKLAAVTTYVQHVPYVR